MLLGAEVKDAKAVLDYIIEHMQAELDTCRAVIGSWDRACVLQSEIKLFTDLRDECVTRNMIQTSQAIHPTDWFDWRCDLVL